MSDPALRALTEHGDVWNDTTEDQLGELVDKVERGAEQFVIVERIVRDVLTAWASERAGWQNLLSWKPLRV